MPYPGWNQKQIERYKAIKASALRAGKSEREAQELAAATVNSVQKARQSQAEPMPKGGSATAGRSEMLRVSDNGTPTYQPNSQYEARAAIITPPKEKTMKNGNAVDDVLKSLFSEELGEDLRREEQINKALDALPQDALEKALARRTTVSEENDQQPHAGSGGKAGSPNTQTPTRPGAGVPQVTTQQQGAGGKGKPKIVKGGEASASESESPRDAGESEGDDESPPDMDKSKKGMKKGSMFGGPIMRFADPAETSDGALADLIAKGMVGEGGISSMPLDVQDRIRGSR